MNFLMGVAKGALDRGSELIEDRSERRQKLVDQLTVKYLETAENAKRRRQTERQEVTKAVKYAHANGLPSDLVQRGIATASSPDAIFKNVYDLGTQFQQARTNKEMRGMWPASDETFEQDYSGDWNDIQGSIDKLSTGGVEDGQLGNTGGFGTPIAEAASNQAMKDAAAFSGMRPEELAGYVQNAPAGSQAGVGPSQGLAPLSKEQLDFVAKSVPKDELNARLARAKEASKRIAEHMGLDGNWNVDTGLFEFGQESAERKREYAIRTTEAQTKILLGGGDPAGIYRDAILGTEARPTSGSGMQSAVQQYVEKFRKREGRDPNPEELQRIERGLRKMGIQ